MRIYDSSQLEHWPISTKHLTYNDIVGTVEQ